jgi:hypothetical protein
MTQQMTGSARSHLREEDSLSRTEGAGYGSGTFSWRTGMRLTVVAVTVSGGDLILVILGPG